MADRFVVAVGKFIHHCGALELVVNNIIKSLAEDSLLIPFVLKSPFNRRISLLRDLLSERSSIDEEFVDSLCKELKEISQKRNIVAHNPIAHSEANKDSEASISVQRYNPGRVEIPKRLVLEDVESLVNRSGELIKRLAKLFRELTAA
jgi:hypothetical protein